MTVGCEPTGHRWRVLDQLAAQQDMALVCVQPLLTGQARQREDYTRDKRDDKDAVLIARLVAQLNCYAPERAEETWARLRQLGARRERTDQRGHPCVQQLRDLLECAWPAVLDAAASPFDSTNWCAALAVVLERCDGDPRRLARRGRERFSGRGAPRTAPLGWSAALAAPSSARCFPRCPIRPGCSPNGAARCSAPAGCSMTGAWSRSAWPRWKPAWSTVLDELGLTELVTSIPGVSRGRGGGDPGRNR